MLLFLAGFLTAVILGALFACWVLYATRIRTDRLCPDCHGAQLTDEGQRCPRCYGAGELDPA